MSARDGKNRLVTERDLYERVRRAIVRRGSQYDSNIDRYAGSLADAVLADLGVEHVLDVHLLTEALRQVCRCGDIDTEPPTSWCDGDPRPRIPHHCDCPLYVIELPTDDVPNARKDAITRRHRLLAGTDG